MKTIIKTKNALCGLMSGLLLLAAGIPMARAAGPFVEPFATDTPDVTDDTYPSFFLNDGTASVSGGELRLDGGGGLFLQRFTHVGFSGDLRITGKVKAATFGSWNVGMEFGNRRFIFHPGHPGGAFRIEDADSGVGGVITGNINMGFNPSVTAFHNMKIEWNSALNQVSITVGDGDCVGGPFVFLWTPDDEGFDPTGPIGFTSQNGGPAFFDDLTVSALSSPLPDPTICDAPPTANAGPNQSIHAGTTVNLDGSASFDDNTVSAALQYSWSFSSVPPGNTAVLNNATTATPSFTPDAVGDYVVQLIVTDDAVPPLSSAPASVTLSSFNQAPTAVATATPLIPYVGQTVSLTGTESTDPEMDSLTYSWTFTSRPAGSAAVLVAANTAIASFTPDVPGSYEVTLTPSDFLGEGTPATVLIVATTAAFFAEGQTASASAIVAALSPGQVTTAGNQNALGNFLAQALQQLQIGNVAQAIVKLNQAIERTDGCALRGAPDGPGTSRDWITNCAAQAEAYALLIAAVDALQD